MAPPCPRWQEPSHYPYEVDENGMLIIGGDLLIPCSDIGEPSDPPGAGGYPPVVRAKWDWARREEIRTCRVAGFETAVDFPASASPSLGAPAADGTLPETGGVALPALLLLAAGASLAAGAPLVLMRSARR